MANLETLFIEIDGSAAKATSSIDSLTNSLGKLASAVANASAPLKNLASALQSIQHATGKGINWKNMMPNTSQKTISNMQQTASAMSSMAHAGNKYASAWQSVSAQAAQSPPMASVLGQTVPNAAGATGNPYSAQMQQSSAQTAAATSGQQGYANATQLANQASQQLNQTLQGTASAMGKVGKSAKGTTQQMSSVATSFAHSQGIFTRVAKSIGSAFHQVTRIAKSMLIRSALRSLVKAAREGLENYYNYSKTVGNGFSEAMDSMASKAAQAKNQLGAALATALSALLPVLNALADAAIWALNAITALFAALGGKDTYSRATRSTTEFTKATKGAGGAVKELLASFDELNVITSGGGGGGGGSAPDYGSMFEEVPVPEWAQIGADLLPWILGALGIEKLLKLINGLRGKHLKYTIDVTQPPEPQWNEFEAQLGRINTALTGISTLVGTISTELWGAAGAAGALALALMACTSPKLTVKLNTDDYDNWKKDLAALKDDLNNNPLTVKINVMVDLREYLQAAMKLSTWCAIPQTKTINIKVNLSQYTQSKQIIDTWIAGTDNKNVKVVMNIDDYSRVRRLLDNWTANVDKKNVKVVVDVSNLISAMNSVSTWVSYPAKKYVYTIMEPTQWHNWVVLADSVTNWASWKATKTVLVKFDANAFAAFSTIANVIDAWAAQTLTKIIDVVIRVTVQEVKSSSQLLNGILSGMNNTGSSKTTTPVVNKSPTVQQNEKGTPSGYWGDTGDTKIIINSDPKGTSGTFTPQNMTDLLLQYNGGGILFNGASWLKANGAYGIPKGDLFVANEAGAELVGSINGKTSVANQEQIIEGISRGVAEANSEQNMLLRQQNEYLRGILQKDTSVRIGASAALGRVAKQSMDMYGSMVGG